MKLSVPTNWQAGLINKLDKTRIDELYGKLARDPIGGGRPLFLLTSTTKRQAQEHIALIHKSGLKFNYLLNALCMGNHEWTRRGQRKIRDFLNWLAEIGVDNITVATPYLLQVVKKCYPAFRVKVSICAGVDSPEQAKYWEELGADEIVLSSWSVNRNFRLLRKIRAAVNCDLELYANTRCLTGCPFRAYHYAGINHASSSLESQNSFFINYCLFMCEYLILLEPWRLVSACWIRPEDLHYYREAGVNSIKLSERDAKTEYLVKVVEAYSNQRYEGNLMDLFIDDSKRLSSRKIFLWKKFLFFFRPDKVNCRLLFHYLKKMPSDLPFFLDNGKLNNFLDFFVQGKCNYNDSGCGGCNHCRRTAGIAVSYTKVNREELLGFHKTLLDSLVDGKLFNYSSAAGK